MASGVKISNLSFTNSISGCSLVPIVQDGITRSAAISSIVAQGANLQAVTEQGFSTTCPLSTSNNVIGHNLSGVNIVTDGTFVSGGLNLIDVFNTDTSITLQDVTTNGNTTTTVISTSNNLSANDIVGGRVFSGGLPVCTSAEADTLQTVTTRGNTTTNDISSSASLSANDVRVAEKIEIDTGNPANPLILSDSTSSHDTLKVSNSSGYVQIGAANPSFAHFYTDRAKYYFDNTIVVDSGIYSAYGDANMLLTVGSAPVDTCNGILIHNDTFNVGVNTQSPSAVLTVQGDISASEGLSACNVTLFGSISSCDNVYGNNIIVGRRICNSPHNPAGLVIQGDGAGAQICIANEGAGVGNKNIYYNAECHCFRDRDGNPNDSLVVNVRDGITTSTNSLSVGNSLSANELNLNKGCITIKDGSPGINLCNNAVGDGYTKLYNNNSSITVLEARNGTNYGIIDFRQVNGSGSCTAWKLGSNTNMAVGHTSPPANAKMSVQGNLSGSEGVISQSLSSCNIIGGCSNNFVNGDSSSILAGCNNRVNGNNAAVNAGTGNFACASTSFVAGGNDNCILLGSNRSAIMGGDSNRIFELSERSVIAGGYSNVASGMNDGNCGNNAIMGGQFNYNSGKGSFVGGGTCNTLSAASNSTIVNGLSNIIDETSFTSFIGGGKTNCLEGGQQGGIVAGECNCIKGSDRGFIGAGLCNCVTGDRGAIVTGNSNHVASGNDFIGGGQFNFVSGGSVFIGAGDRNCALSGRSAVVAGTCNCVNSCRSFIGSGSANNIFPSGKYSSIVGGCGNTTKRCMTFIGGGAKNMIAEGENVADYSTIVGGFSSMIVKGSCSFIGGGRTNAIDDSCSSVIAGGYKNCITDCGAGADDSVIGGGKFNFICSAKSVIGGGCRNCIFGNARYGTVAGGRCNFISTSECHASIGGGQLNCVDGDHGTVAGGYKNKVYSFRGAIGGGSLNCIQSSGTSSFIGGGCNNCVREQCGAVLGGCGNMACNRLDTVVGGCCNRTSGCSSSCRNFIGGGALNCLNGIHSCDNAIVGGADNEIQCYSCCSFIGGGHQNVLAGTYNIIGGGQCNVIRCCATNVNVKVLYGNIVGGKLNAICPDSSYSTVLGGCCNFIGPGAAMSVSFGKLNCITSDCSGILGGCSNCLTHDYSYALGLDLHSNQACTTFVNNLSSQCSIHAGDGANFTGVITGCTLTIVDGIITSVT